MSGNLGWGANAAQFDTKTWTLQTLENEGSNLALIYAGKFVGAVLERVPVAGWLPWELIMPQPPSGATIDNDSVNYRALETVCFAYVKPDGAPESEQKLSYISNMVSVSSFYMFDGFNGSGGSYAYPSSPSENSSTYAQNYANPTSEVNQYEDYSNLGTSWLSYFGFSNPDNSQSLQVSITTPSFPAQIY